MIRVLLIALILSGCVASSEKMNDISVGMTKTEVVQIMGKPDRISASGSTEYLIYRLGATDDLVTLETDYFVRLNNGVVDQYGKMGDFDSTKDPAINVNINQ